MLAVSVTVALMTLFAGITWALAQDVSRHNVVPPGTSVTGLTRQTRVAVGGMDLEHARLAVRLSVVDPLLRTVTVKAPPGGTYTMEPAQFVSVDVDATLRRAMAPSQREPLPIRLARSLLDRPLGVSAPIVFKVDTRGLDRWAKRLARRTHRAPVDARMSVSTTGTVVISAGRGGYALAPSAAYRAVYAALLSGRKQVRLCVRRLTPKRTPTSFGRSVVILRASTTLLVYDNASVVATFPVAVGMLAHPTPLGDWKIVAKAKNPSWLNPHQPWSVHMPDYIAPGPRNPLGERALYLDATGIRIHGTSNDASVGTDASHGCMRMHEADVIKLYSMVRDGTRVYIRQGPAKRGTRRGKPA